MGEEGDMAVVAASHASSSSRARLEGLAVPHKLDAKKQPCHDVCARGRRFIVSR